MDWPTMLGAWLGVGLTLLMYSFLYKDNPFFKVGEHLYLGVSLGYLLVQAVFQTLYDSLWLPFCDPLLHAGKAGYTGEPKPDWWLIVPVVLGLLIYMRMSQKLAWMSRYTFAFIVGYGSGVGLAPTISGSLLQQLTGTVEPLLRWSELTPFMQVSQVLVIVGVVCTVTYFLFSVEHKGAVRVASRIGIYFIMICFGSAFGYTVMGRMSLLVSRLQDLIRNAHSESRYATYVCLAFVAGGLVAWELTRKKQPSEGEGH